MKNYRIGIDLGGTYIKGGIVDEANQIVLQRAVPTKAEEGAYAVLDRIVLLTKDLMTAEYAKDGNCIGVGVGNPGTVDAKRGFVPYSNNIKWENVPVADYLERQLELPVKVDNDANCAALGVLLSEKDATYDSAILLTLGTGLGCGIILHGKIYGGEHAGGAEVGHMMLKSGGRKCSCGKRGCFEAYCSTTGLIKDVEKAIKKADKKTAFTKSYKKDPNLDGRRILEAVDAGDPVAKKAFAGYLNHLAEGMAGIIDIFRPDVVYIGGGISARFDLMEEFLNDYAKKKTFGGEHAFAPVVKKAPGGNDVGIIGAAGLFTRGA